MRIQVNGDDIWREVGFVEYSAENPFGVVSNIKLRGSWLGALVWGLGCDVQNRVRHIHQRCVEGSLLGIRGVAPFSVRSVVVHKCLVDLDFLDCRSPLSLPIVGDVQNALRKVLRADENLKSRRIC